MAFSLFNSKAPQSDEQGAGVTLPPPAASGDIQVTPAAPTMNDVAAPVVQASVVTTPDPADDDQAPALVMPEEAPPQPTVDPSSFIFSPEADKPDAPMVIEDEDEKEEKGDEELMDLMSTRPSFTPMAPVPVVSNDDDTALPPIDEEEKEDEGEFSDTARHEVEEVLKHDIDQEEAEIAKLEEELARADAAYKHSLADLEERRKALEDYETKIKDQQEKIANMKEEAQARRSRLSKVLQDL